MIFKETKDIFEYLDKKHIKAIKERNKIMKKLSSFKNEKELMDFLSEKFEEYYINYLDNNKDLSLKDFEKFVNEKMTQLWKINKKF